MHRLRQAKNHQLRLWQPWGTWRTILKGVEASYLIERNQRLCSGKNVFGIPEVLDFLVQPATVLNFCILCVYFCKVRVVLQRTTTVYILKWGEIMSPSKQIPVPLSLCVSEVYAHKATAGRICWGQSLVLDSDQLLRSILYHVGLQVLEVCSIHVW